MADIKEIADHRWTADPNLASELPVPTGVAINPMTTAGDIIVGGTGGAETRLAKGADSSVLTIDPTTHLPVWLPDTDLAPPVTITGTDPATVPLTVTAAAGQTSAATAAVVGVTGQNTIFHVTENGKDNLFVGPSDGTSPLGVVQTYSNNAADGPFGAFTNSNGRFVVGNHGQVTIRTDTGATDNPLTLSAPGTSNTLLAFTSAGNLVIGTSTTVQDDLIIGGAGGALSILNKGTDGQVLTVDPTTHHLLWATPATGVTFPLTSAGNETFQPNGVANNALTITNPASAVNGVSVAGSATGNPSTIQASGGDTNLGLTVNTKGSGVLTLQTAGAGNVVVNSGTATGSVLLGGSAAPSTVGRAALTATGVASGVNGVTITQAPTGGTPLIDATGSDAAITMYVRASGTLILQSTSATGSVWLGGSAGISQGSKALTVTGVTSGVNGVTISQGATGGPAKIAATGSDASVGLVITGQSTGKLFTQAPYAAAADQTATRNITGGSNTNGLQRRRVYVTATLAGSATGTVGLTYTTTTGATTLTAAKGPKASTASTSDYTLSFAVDPGATYSVNTATTGTGASATLVQWIEVDE